MIVLRPRVFPGRLVFVTLSEDGVYDDKAVLHEFA